MEKFKEYQLILSTVIVSAAILFSSLIFAAKIQKNENITVTGSASKIVKSDSAKFVFEIQTLTKTQKEAYTKIKSQEKRIRDYLAEKGINNEDIDFKTIGGYYHYETDAKGNQTGRYSYYSANQSVEIKSNDVLKIKELSSDIGSLATDSIDINSMQPEYYYSDLATLKVNLLKDAALDAKQRAKSMLSATGANVGKVQSMKMGVFQITPVDSTMVADFGLNDTTTIDKKVTAVTNIVFKVR